MSKVYQHAPFTIGHQSLSHNDAVNNLVIPSWELTGNGFCCVYPAYVVFIACFKTDYTKKNTQF